MTHRHLHFRLSERQYQFLVSRGEQLDKTMADVLRQLIRSEMVAHKQMDSADDRAERKQE